MIEVEQLGPVTKLRVARTILGRGRYFTAAYLVDGLLVDSGCAHAAAELVRALEGKTVHTVVNTHSHEDHIAANAALQRRHGARLLAHPLATPVLADPRRLQRQQLYRRLFWGYPEPSVVEPIGAGEEVATQRHRFVVVATPGHSEDHIALHEPREGWIFVGDAFVGGKDRALRPSSDPWQIIASLRRLAALEPTVMYPGSGTVYREPRRALREKVEYLEQLGGQILALHRRGWSARRIRRRILGGEPYMARLTAGDFSGLNLVHRFIACAAGSATEDRSPVTRSGGTTAARSAPAVERCRTL